MEQPSTELSVIKHRREARRQIWLPIILTYLILIGILGILFVLAMADTMSPQQINVISSFLLVPLCLLPLALVVLVLDVMMIALAFYLGKTESLVIGLFRFAHGITLTINTTTQKFSQLVAEPVKKLSARLTRWGNIIAHLLGIFVPGDNKHVPDDR
jgi:lysylphosphatidylglycerol synthetase-like protein (DUF2156 family)